jgi:hypothetical protein
MTIPKKGVCKALKKIILFFSFKDLKKGEKSAIIEICVFPTGTRLEKKLFYR